MPFFPNAPVDTEEYLVYPRDQDRTNRPRIEQIEASIRHILGSNACIEQIIVGPKLLFWLIALSVSQVEQIRKLEGVSCVSETDDLQNFGVVWISTNCGTG